MSRPSVIYDFDPRNLPADYLQAIGLAIAAASQTEAVLSAAMAGCLGVRQVAALALTPHMAIPLKLNVLRSVAALLLPPRVRADLEAPVNAVEQALTSRNKYAHDSWCRDPTTGEVFRNAHSARAKVKLELVPTSVTEIEQEASRIYAAGMSLMAVLVDHNLLPK